MDKSSLIDHTEKKIKGSTKSIHNENKAHKNLTSDKLQNLAISYQLRGSQI